ncbi:MAG: cytochrome c [Acetobacteraceae bacterium]|nr:cytochrome c [Acetobacteraceae bacterium]
MRRWVFAVVMAGAPGIVLAQGTAQGTTQRAGGDAVAGRAVAQTWCASCHGVDARPAAASDQAPGFAAIAGRAGVTADGLRVFLTKPHGRMPDLSLSRADIADTVAYILSLRGK